MYYIDATSDADRLELGSYLLDLIALCVWDSPLSPMSGLPPLMNGLQNTHLLGLTEKRHMIHSRRSLALQNYRAIATVVIVTTGTPVALERSPKAASPRAWASTPLPSFPSPETLLRV